MISRKGLPIKNQTNNKSRPSLLGRLLFWFILAGLIFIGLGFLSRIQKFQVSIGEYENIIVTDTGIVTKELESYLSGRFLYPKSNRLWFSDKKAERFIQQTFPRIASVKISSSKGVLSIWGEEREGKYLWCGQNLQAVRLDSPCYFADSTGFIFDTAPYFSGTSYLRLYGGAPENPIGTHAFSQDIFDVYEVLNTALASFGFKIQAIVLLPENQLEFILVSNHEITKAPKIKYYTLNDKDLVVHNITEALKEESVLLDIKNNYDRLEYLDTRFKNQIIYRFFDESGNNNKSYEEITEETTTNIETREEDTASSER